MKPHIFKGRNFWFCWSRAQWMGSVGYGHSPAAAYAEWQKLTKGTP